MKRIKPADRRLLMKIRARLDKNIIWDEIAAELGYENTSTLWHKFNRLELLELKEQQDNPKVIA